MPPRQLFVFRFGCWAAVISALVHLAGHLAGPTPPSNDTERQLIELFSTYRFPMPLGGPRTLSDFMNGFSLMFAMQLATMGVLGLVVAKRAQGDGPLMRAVARTCAIGAVVLFVVSLRYFFLIPSMMLSVVALCYAMAAVSPPE